MTNTYLREETDFGLLIINR